MRLRSIFYTPQNHWTVAFPIVIALAVMMFGTIPLLGLPGAIALVAGELTLQVLGAGLFGYVGIAALPGDAGWGAAIAATWIWPPCIIVAHLVAFRVLHGTPAWQRWLAFWGVLLAWATVVTLGIVRWALAGA